MPRLTTADLRAAIEALDAATTTVSGEDRAWFANRLRELAARGPLLQARHDAFAAVLALIDAAQEPTGAIVGREDVAEAVEDWGTPTLDAAWKEAEAALPEGWQFMGLRLDPGRGVWFAWAQARYEFALGTPLGYEQTGEGDTPAAALQTLAERLRAKP